MTVPKDEDEENEVVNKIRETIRFIRNQLFEVPFIAFYRKEHVDPTLAMPDLWKIYQYDEKVTIFSHFN